MANMQGDRAKYPEPINPMPVLVQRMSEWARLQSKKFRQQKFNSNGYQIYDKVERHGLGAEGLRIREDLFRQDCREFYLSDSETLLTFLRRNKERKTKLFWQRAEDTSSPYSTIGKRGQPSMAGFGTSY